MTLFLQPVVDLPNAAYSMMSEQLGMKLCVSKQYMELRSVLVFLIPRKSACGFC